MPLLHATRLRVRRSFQYLHLLRIIHHLHADDFAFAGHFNAYFPIYYDVIIFD